MKYKFAERVLPLSQEGAYAVLAQAKALEAEGRDIIHLEIFGLVVVLFQLEFLQIRCV